MELKDARRTESAAAYLLLGEECHQSLQVARQQWTALHLQHISVAVAPRQALPLTFEESRTMGDRQKRILYVTMCVFLVRTVRLFRVASLKAQGETRDGTSRSNLHRGFLLAAPWVACVLETCAAMAVWISGNTHAQEHRHQKSGFCESGPVR